MLDILLAHDGVDLLFFWAKNYGMPILVRENVWKILFLLADNYALFPRLKEAGLIELCCAYLSPTASSSQLTSQLAHTLLLIMMVYDKQTGTRGGARTPSELLSTEGGEFISLLRVTNLTSSTGPSKVEAPLHHAAPAQASPRE